MSGVATTSGITLGGFLAAEITIAVVTGTFVACRLGANWSNHHRLLVDDYVSLVALGFLGALSGLYYYTVKWLNDPTIAPIDLARVAVATYFVAAYSNYTAKAALLLLYTKIFGPKVWVRRIAYTTLALGFVGYTATSLVGTLDNPEHKTLDAAYFNRLFGHSYGIAVANAVFNLAIDITAFLIPIPIVYGLQLPLRKKIGLAFLFVLGLVAIATGSVSLHYRRTSSQKTTEDLTIVSTFTLLDSAIGIVLGCIPAIRSLWIKGYIDSSVFARLRSRITTNKGVATEQSQSRSHLQTRDTQFTPDSHNYIELEEGGYDKSRNDVKVAGLAY
ncbi:hypothetical protein F4808DRAFT_430038 [Astrocystis sublimbata]|nr:hypothetical protein F4808DRAFT_430038 [Astrocystis sublimbata]